MISRNVEKKTRALLHVSHERLGFVNLAWNDKEDVLVNIVTALFLTLKGICEVKCTSLQFFSKFPFSFTFYEMTMAAVKIYKIFKTLQNCMFLFLFC